MKLRKQRSVKEISLDEDFQDDGDIVPMEVADWAPNPEQLCWASELRRILVGALKNLRPISRMVFVLRDIEGLSIDQTAVVLNMSHTAVKARLWRVRLQLREVLSKYFSQKQESAEIDFSLSQRHGPSTPTFSNQDEESTMSHASLLGHSTLQTSQTSQ